MRAVIVDENGAAKGVAYIDRDTKKEVEVYAKVVVLAGIVRRDRAHHVEFEVPALAHRHRKFQRTAGHAILCEHLYGGPGYGYLPQLLGQPATPDNIADSTVAWMPRWQNLKNPREEKFIRGYSLYIGGGCGEFPGYYGQIEGFGSQYKRDIKRYYPTPVGALIQAPTLPSPTTTSISIPRKKISSEFPSFASISSGARTNC